MIQAIFSTVLPNMSPCFSAPTVIALVIALVIAAVMGACALLGRSASHTQRKSCCQFQLSPEHGFKPPTLD